MVTESQGRLQLIYGLLFRIPWRPIPRVTVSSFFVTAILLINPPVEERVVSGGQSGSSVQKPLTLPFTARGMPYVKVVSPQPFQYMIIPLEEALPY